MRLLETWRPTGQGIRRVVVLCLEGLRQEAIHRYLNQGLLHNLALLSDIGTQTVLGSSEPIDANSIATAFHNCGLRTTNLPATIHSPTDLTTICTVDRELQEKLIAELLRDRRGAVVATFNMPAELQQLFGPTPDESQQLILRDAYARMDEIVGKAFSFVDDQTALLVVIADNADPTAAALKSSGLVFCNAKLKVPVGRPLDLIAIIEQLLGNQLGVA